VATLALALLAASSAWLLWRVSEMSRAIGRLQHHQPAAGPPAAGNGTASQPPLPSPGAGAGAAGQTTGSTAPTSGQAPPQRPPADGVADSWRAFLADRQHLSALARQVARSPRTTAAAKSFLAHLQPRVETGALTAQQSADLQTLLFEHAACLALPGLHRQVDRRWDSRNLTESQRAQLLKALAAGDSDLAHARPGPAWEQAVILRWFAQ
jgi:hypothetical protein